MLFSPCLKRMAVHFGDVLGICWLFSSSSSSFSWWFSEQRESMKTSLRQECIEILNDEKWHSLSVLCSDLTGGVQAIKSIIYNIYGLQSTCVPFFSLSFTASLDVYFLLISMLLRTQVIWGSVNFLMVPGENMVKMQFFNSLIYFFKLRWVFIVGFL